MPLKLGLVLLWQEMSGQAFILRLRKPGPGGARGSLLAFPWGRRHRGGSVRARPAELGRARPRGLEGQPVTFVARPCVCPAAATGSWGF